MIFNELTEKELAYLNKGYVLLKGPKIDDIVCLGSGERSVLFYTKENFETRTDPQKITASKISQYEFFTPPLGYTYLESMNSFYLSRIPHRHWRLGVSNQNLKDSGFPRIGDELVITMLRNIREKNYPGFQDAVKKSRELGTIAFSRNYAISVGRDLFYKDKLLGNFSRPIEVSSEKEKIYHEINIGSLTAGNIEFFVSKKKETDYENDDI